ncbi:hypothetical protein HY480_00430, partial [Candidatus Uhrbacteria bacterium]|nr:hypothetical protein [Candidatus Uhrbacteria bacterium]
VFTHPLLQGCVLVAVALAIALWVEVPGRFPDPDSFYHAGMGELASQGKFPARFPWLDLTVLRDQYADLHLVYHLILVPFVAVLGPMAGIRVATITAFVLLTLAFFLLLRSQKIRGALVWTLLLVGTASFAFRMNLAKSQGFALTVLFLGILSLLQRSRTKTFLAAVFATWLSTAWPVYALVVLVFGFHHILATIIGAPRQWHAVLRAVGDALGLLISAAIGVAAGFIVNPYFPGNLTVAKQQIVDIALGAQRLGVVNGMEWQALSTGDFVRAIGFLFPILALAVIGCTIRVIELIRNEKTDDRDAVAAMLTFGVLSIAFAFLALASQRHLEFFVPFAVLFAATGCQPVLRWFWPPRIAVGWRRPGMIRRALSTVGLLVAIAVFAVGSVRALRMSRGYFVNGHPADYLRGTATWIRDHAAPGAIVFHADWGDAPALFLWNRDQRYLIGLDPIFAALKDVEEYRTWLAVGRGELGAQTVQTIRETFGADYALVTAKQPDLDAILTKDRKARLAHEDAGVKVYELAR